MGTFHEDVWTAIMWSTLSAVSPHKRRRILDDLFADLDPRTRHRLRGHLYPWRLGGKPACDLIFTRTAADHLVALGEVKFDAKVNYTSLSRYTDATAGEDPLSQRILTDYAADPSYINIHQGDGYRAFLGRQPDRVRTFADGEHRDHGRFAYLFIAPGEAQLRRWKDDLISQDAWEFINLTAVIARWRSRARSIPELWPLVVASEEMCGGS